MLLSGFYKLRNETKSYVQYTCMIIINKAYQYNHDWLVR